MKSNLHIVKVGGNVINDPAKLTTFLASFSLLDGMKVLVHGGGREASDLADRLGTEVKMIEGRRITDDAMIDIVTMVYAGVNKRLVAALQSLDNDAIGLSGADGNLILSDKRPVTNGIDYGWVGDPKSVNTDLLQSLIDSAIVPVVAPLTHDGKGHMLNTNADTIASVLAVAMSQLFAVNLVYAFEYDGVMRDLKDPDSLITSIDHPTYNQLKQEGVISDGMIPKLDNAFQAISLGVNSVSIVKYDKINQLTKKKNGFTTIS